MIGRTAPALAAACGAGFLWGTGALVVNLLIVRFGLSAESVSFWRFALGAAALLALFGRPAFFRVVPAHALLLAAAGTCMSLYVLAWFLAIARIGPAVPTLIALCLPPVLVTVWSVARGREHWDTPLVLALAAALGGTGLVVGHHGTAGSALYSPLVWPSELPPEAWLLYLGLVTAALALLAFNWGAARLSPTALTVATLVEPLTAVLLAALLLGERLGPAQWVGALLMLASIGALGRRDARRATESLRAA